MAHVCRGIHHSHPASQLQNGMLHWEKVHIESKGGTNTDYLPSWPFALHGHHYENNCVMAEIHPVVIFALQGCSLLAVSFKNF